MLLVCIMGRDSSVGIATRYGLDGPGIESRWGARFFAPVQTSPGAYPACCTIGSGSFTGVKRSGRGADHPPPSKCLGHERVGLYLYSSSGLQWPFMEAPLPLPLPYLTGMYWLLPEISSEIEFFKFWVPIIRTFCIFVTMDVRIRGKFRSQLGSASKMVW